MEELFQYMKTFRSQINGALLFPLPSLSLSIILKPIVYSYLNKLQLLMFSFFRLIADVADHAAKMSVEEHMQSTTIEALQKDLDSGCL